jgi:phosphoribosyl 1,2-cyclic phosphate phosphodiesterase
MSYRLTLLGTGSSGGVPRIGNNWGACDPNNPKNRRRRCSALIDRISGRSKTTVLIDTPADIREQLLGADVRNVDGVLYTHDHADHTHGIDDLRMLTFLMKKRVDVHFDERTRASLIERFSYCFSSPKGSNYPAILNAHDLHPLRPVIVDGAGGPIEALPVPCLHGDIDSLAFRIGNVAYSPDVGGLPETSLEHLQGLDLWVVDALRYTPHPAHWHLQETLTWIERLKPKRAILTNLHIDLDYATLKRDLPAHVEPGYDGLQVHF